MIIFIFYLINDKQNKIKYIKNILSLCYYKTYILNKNIYIILYFGLHLILRLIIV